MRSVASMLHAMELMTPQAPVDPHWTFISTALRPAAPAIQVRAELGAQVHDGNTTGGPCHLHQHPSAGSAGPVISAGKPMAGKPIDFT